MKKIVTPLILILSICFTYQLQAADILVNGSGLPGSYLKLSDAVNAASNGDRILVSPQILPYQENNDTLFIDKDLTIMPYVENAYISYQGHILLNLDNINNLTIIGVRSTSSKSLLSQINDTSLNNYSIINVIDCQFEYIRLDQPKTSLYLSYSKVEKVAFSHGNIIGNRIDHLFFGTYDYGYNGTSGATSPAGTVLQTIANNYNNSLYSNDIFGQEPFYFWPQTSTQPSNFTWPSSYSSNNSRKSPLNWSSFITECELFNGTIPFGNVNTYSDTCLVIANSFPTFYDNYAMNLFSQDFPIHIFNNYFGGGETNIFLLCPIIKGTNRVINNWNSTFYLHASNCFSDSSFNLKDVNIDIQNNDACDIQFLAPVSNPSSGSYASLPIITNSVWAYNNSNIYSYHEVDNIENNFFLIGPGPDGDLGSPALEFLNLDLTQNRLGYRYGTHPWQNYHSDFSDDNRAGFMPSGSKARITYLNLPTQIFNPSNLRIKAKTIHGNRED